MTCKHRADDINCHSHPDYNYYHPAAPSRNIVSPPMTPDPEEYDVLDIKECGDYLVLKVQYPSCKACSYEGIKVLVVKSTLKDAVMWKKIDPHFREPSSTIAGQKPIRQSPSPVARFPATVDGWNDAIEYASNK